MTVPVGADEDLVKSEWLSLRFSGMCGRRDNSCGVGRRTLATLPRGVDVCSVQMFSRRMTAIGLCLELGLERGR